MDTRFFDALEKKIDGCATCSDLQLITEDITARFDQMKADIMAQMAEISPLMVVPGANFGAIISWITSMINTFTGPYVTYLAQVAELTTRLAAIQSKIAQKAHDIGCGAV
jgi:hypothetical protein